MLERYHLSQREISQKYDRFAPSYDCVEAIPDLLGVGRLRRRLLRRARGKFCSAMEFASYCFLATRMPKEIELVKLEVSGD